MLIKVSPLSDTSESLPSVLSDALHQPCSKIEGTFYSGPAFTRVLRSINYGLQSAGVQAPWIYSTESDLPPICIGLSEEYILSALGLNLRLTSELGIKCIRPDITVLMLGYRPDGVVKVKKPGKDILLQLTVLGELLDLILLVEGFHGAGLICGILTTGEH